MATKVRDTTVAFSWALLALLVGCTSAPVAEFSAYRDAFNDARRAGEEVLLSYAASRDSVLPPGAPQPMPSRSQGLQPDANSANVDEVLEYMAGWDAVGAYNEFIAAIIEGKEESTVQSLYGGFQSVVGSLPTKTASAIASATGPWSVVIDQAISQLDQESRRRRFVQKLKEGGLIVHAILALHASSAELIFDAQYLANERKYNPIANKFRRTVKDMAKLLASYKFSNEADIVADINRSIASFPADGGEPLNSAEIVSASRNADTAATTRMDKLKGDLDAYYEAAVALTRELEDYRSLLSRFRELVNATDNKLRQSVHAAASGETRPPEIVDIRRLVIEVRKALAQTNQGG